MFVHYMSEINHHCTRHGTVGCAQKYIILEVFAIVVTSQHKETFGLGIQGCDNVGKVEVLEDWSVFVEFVKFDVPIKVTKLGNDKVFNFFMGFRSYDSVVTEFVNLIRTILHNTLPWN